MTKRRLAVFDIDGTLFRSGLYREVFYELNAMGAIPAVMGDAVTLKHRQWHHRLSSNAFEEFQHFLVDKLDAYLPKLRTVDYDKAVSRVIENKTDNVYAYTRDLLHNLQDQGYMTIAISGSQQELVEPFARRYGFDAWIGQQWERGDEFFTGNVTKTHSGKDKLIHKFVKQYDLTLQDSYAVGDTIGDASMLALVDHPVAFNPSHELLETALQNNWKVVIERKNTSYELTTGAPHEPYILAKTNQH